MLGWRSEHTCLQKIKGREKSSKGQGPSVVSICTHLELRGIVPQLDLQQKPIFPHLVFCLLLQLLHQALQELGGLNVLLWIIKIY